MQDVPPEAVTRLEQQVLADHHLSRLAEAWMLGTSRSLQDFITYHSHLLRIDTKQAPDCSKD